MQHVTRFVVNKLVDNKTVDMFFGAVHYDAAEALYQKVGADLGRANCISDRGRALARLGEPRSVSLRLARGRVPVPDPIVPEAS